MRIEAEEAERIRLEEEAVALAVAEKAR